MAFPVDRIRDACRDRNLTIAELERALGFGNGVIGRWGKQKTSPPIVERPGKWLPKALCVVTFDFSVRRYPRQALFSQIFIFFSIKKRRCSFAAPYLFASGVKRSS